jgi:hypothetical protein
MMDNPLGVPAHLFDLVSEVQSGADIERVLLKHIDRLSTDRTLNLAYKSLGFSPDSRRFKRPLHKTEVLRTLRTEFTEQPFLSDFVSEGLDWLNEHDLRSDLLRTFYDNSIDMISDPNQLGLVSCEYPDPSELCLPVEESSLSTMWSVPDAPLSDDPGSPMSSSEALTPMKGFSFDKSPSRKHKGLRVISISVRDIVSLKRTTTYKEVADLLIQELELGNLVEAKEQFKEEKNVRRRVYDALNVLVAAGVVSKTGKNVQWKNSALPVRLTNQTSKKAQINKNSEKRGFLRQLMEKVSHLEALMTRNRLCRQSTSILRMPFITLVPSDPTLSSVRSTQLCIKTNTINTAAELRMQKPFLLLGDLDVVVRVPLHADMSGLPAAARRLCSV